MHALRSALGAFLAAAYLVMACWVALHELRHTGGGWINLRGMGTTIVTAPSQATFGYVFRALGVPRVNYSQPGALGLSQLALHILVTAGVVYLLGAGIEGGARWLRAHA